VQSNVALRKRKETLSEMPLAKFMAGGTGLALSRKFERDGRRFHNELKEAGSDE